jgi:hypothetical protein
MKSKDFIKIESFFTSKKLEEKFFFDFDKKHEFSNLFWREAKHYKKRKIRYFSRNFFKNKKKNKDFTKMRGKILSSISFLLNKKKKIFFVNKKFVNKKYFSGYSILSEDNRKVLKNKTKFNIGSMRSVVFRDKVKRSRFLIF